MENKVETIKEKRAEIVGVNVIRFKKLSAWLKVAVIGGWVYVIVFGITFLMGFIEGYLGL